MFNINEIKNDLKSLGNPEKAKIHQKFFKTGKGQYGEGDIFLGIKVPVLRKKAKKYQTISFSLIKKLICSPIHEERFLSLVILINRFSGKKSNELQRKKIFDFYIKHKKYINNWDLVDISAPHILGQWLINKDKEILYKLSKSLNLWDKRIAIISTLYFIRQNDFKDTLKICEILLNDKHDLIHKAAGWMLREIGKKDIKVEENFLKKNYKKMPRTMLRYAIERFPEKLRLSYLKNKF